VTDDEKQSPFLLPNSFGLTDDDVTLEQILQEEATIASLRSSNLKLLQQLEKAKTHKAEVVQAVYDAASAASSALTLKPVAKPARDNRKRAEEVAVAVLSDWQLAKITPTYDSATCEQRVEKYAEKVVELTDIQRLDHPVRKLHVWVLGDIIEGELIFPGQHWLIDSSLYMQVCVDGPRILGNFIRTMLANFDEVHVTAVIGNHGRLGGRAAKDMNGESNGDRMLYRITQQLLAGEKRVTWNIPDGDRERNWYAVAEVGNYSCMLFHGDQIRGGFAGFPYYGLAKKVWGWKAGAIPEHFDDVYFGHWHTPVKSTLNNVIARCSGSTESYNSLRPESLAAMGRPSQPLMFVHPDKGIVTAEYTVWLSDDFYGKA
jgi:predicted phosphodiesterase